MAYAGILNFKTYYTVTAGYWSLGQVSSFFAIPPGYASPIWPAAGFALMMGLFYGPRTLIGVWIGSFLLNLAFSDASLFEPSSLWNPAGVIACDAVLQAHIACKLVLRFTRYPDLASRVQEPLIFALLGGPLACITSSIVGTTALYVNGIVSQDEIFSN